jgi:hypothetical protein
VTEEAESTQGQSTWLIIAAVLISVSSLLCCGCLAIAWVVGDVAIQFLDQFSSLIGLLPF